MQQKSKGKQLINFAGTIIILEKSIQNPLHIAHD